MATQTLPRSSSEYAARRRAEIGAATAAVARLWRRMDDDFDLSYFRIEGSILAVLDEGQRRVAAEAQAVVPRVIEETGQRLRDPQYEFDPDRLVGTAGDGLGTDSMAYGAVIRARSAVASGATVPEALAAGGQFLTLATGTLLSDTARTTERVGGHARRVSGWVRGLNPPSCGRCVILAGKRERSSDAFDRHPGCDCIAIPAAESVAGDLMVDPHAYLDDLDDDALAKALGSRSNAQAFRDGADPAQLVNAYRKSGGVRPAQVFDRRVKYTTEGTTRRGFAYSQMRRAGYAQRQTDVRESGRRYFQARAPRLMPESIYQIATDREDALRLLRLYGWIT